MAAWLKSTSVTNLIPDYLARIAAAPRDAYLRHRFAADLLDSDDPTQRARGRLILDQFAEEAARQAGLDATAAAEVRTANLWAETVGKCIEKAIASYEREWLAPLDRDLVLGVAWELGAPSGLTLAGEIFSTEISTILPLAPTVTSLTVLMPRAGAGLAVLPALQDPCLARIESLRLMGPWGPEAARVLATSPHLGNVTALHLSDTAVGSSGIRALLGARTLPRLQTLTLSGNKLAEDGAIALLRIPALPPELRDLILTDCGIDDDTAVSLAANSLFATLHHLDLRQNPLTPAGIRELLASDALHSVALQLDLDPLTQPEASQVAEQLWQREQTVMQTAQE